MKVLQISWFPLQRSVDRMASGSFLRSMKCESLFTTWLPAVALQVRGWVSCLHCCPPPPSGHRPDPRGRHVSSLLLSSVPLMQAHGRWLNFSNHTADHALPFPETLSPWLLRNLEIIWFASWLRFLLAPSHACKFCGDKNHLWPVRCPPASSEGAWNVLDAYKPFLREPIKMQSC